jgi:hypothetical protein
MSDDRIALAEASIEEALNPGADERRETEERDRKRRIAQRKAFLIQTMQHPEGRLWLKETLDRFHAFETRLAAVNGFARDDLGTFLMLGEQRCGWAIWEQLDEADPVLASRIRRGERLEP